MERERHIMRDNAKSLLAEMKYWREAASSLANTGVRTCASARTLLTRVILASVTRSRAGIPTAIWRMAGPSFRRAPSTPSELFTFLHINNMKVNILVSRELLISPLQQSKVSQSHCFLYSLKFDAFMFCDDSLISTFYTYCSLLHRLYRFHFRNLQFHFSASPSLKDIMQSSKECVPPLHEYM